MICFIALIGNLALPICFDWKSGPDFLGDGRGSFDSGAAAFNRSLQEATMNQRMKTLPGFCILDGYFLPPKATQFLDFVLRR